MTPAIAGTDSKRQSSTPCHCQKELLLAPYLLRTGTPIKIHTGIEAPATWTVCDDDGQTILSGQGQGPEMTIDTKELKSGVYRVTATTGNEQRSNRIIVL